MFFTSLVWFLYRKFDDICLFFTGFGCKFDSTIDGSLNFVTGEALPLVVVRGNSFSAS